MKNFTLVIVAVLALLTFSLSTLEAASQYGLRYGVSCAINQSGILLTLRASKTIDYVMIWTDVYETVYWNMRLEGRRKTLIVEPNSTLMFSVHHIDGSEPVFYYTVPRLGC